MTSYHIYIYIYIYKSISFDMYTYIYLYIYLKFICSRINVFSYIYIFVCRANMIMKKLIYIYIYIKHQKYYPRLNPKVMNESNTFHQALVWPGEGIHSPTWHQLFWCEFPLLIPSTVIKEPHFCGSNMFQWHVEIPLETPITSVHLQFQNDGPWWVH